MINMGSLRIAFAEFALSRKNKIGQKMFQLSTYRWRKRTERMERTDISLYIAPSGGKLRNCAKGKAVFLNVLCIKIVHDSLENSRRILAGKIHFPQ